MFLTVLFVFFRIKKFVNFNLIIKDANFKNKQKSRFLLNLEIVLFKSAKFHVPEILYEYLYNENKCKLILGILLLPSYFKPNIRIF